MAANIYNIAASHGLCETYALLSLHVLVSSPTKEGLLDSRANSWRRASQVSFSEGGCTILLAYTATVQGSDLLLSVAAFTIIDHAEYSYAQK